MLLPLHESSPVPAVAGRRVSPWLLAGILALLTLGLYWPAVQHGFVYDDTDYLTSNVQVQQGLTLANLRWAFTHPVAANWHPVTVLSHMLDCQIFGLNPEGPHLENLLFHAANTVLVFLLLWRLTGARWRSVLVAALFGVHPLHIESVAWVAERKDVLSGFFGLLTLLAYARYAQIHKASGAAPSQNAGSYYGLALGGYALGLMSKPMLVTWPGVLLLLDYWPLQRIESGHWWRLVREKLPFMLLAAGASALAVATQQGAMAENAELPLGARLGNALVSYCRYLGKLFWPENLAVFYPHPVWWPAGAVAAAGLGLVVLSGLLLRQWRRRPYLPMGWLWFVGTLVPVIGLVQVGSQAMADRYTYLPSLGIFVLVVWGAEEVARRWHWRWPVSVVAGGLVLAGNLAVTHRQLGYWQDNETLFRHALAVTADNSIARGNLGEALEKKGQTAAALAEYQAALQLAPNDADIHLSIGDLYVRSDRLDAALDQYQTALQWRPDCAEAYNGLGTVFFRQGRTNAALEAYQNVIRLQPGHASAHNKLGVLLVKQGQVAAAASQFQEAIRWQPNSPEPYYNLGAIYFNQGEIDRAIQQYEAAIRWNPDYEEAHYSLGVALNRAGQSAAAIGQYREAIRLRPDHPEAHYNLGNVLARLGQMAAAAGEYQEVLRLQPDRAEAHNNLGFALFAQGRGVEAIREFREALRLQPDYPAAQKNLDRALAARKEPVAP